MTLRTGDGTMLITTRPRQSWFLCSRGCWLPWPTLCPSEHKDQSQPSGHQGPRGLWMARVLQPLHMAACLKEHWLVWLTLLSSAYSLLRIATMDTSYIDCRCDCQQPPGYFEKCYQDSVRGSRGPKSGTGTKVMSCDLSPSPF